MEFRDALKALRKELGVTQSELASALHISGMTVSRWELGKTYPNRAVLSLLLGYAYTHSAQKATIDMIKSSINDASRQKTHSAGIYGTVAIEHSSLVDFIDKAPFPIYVSDVETDYVLYANKKALEMVGMNRVNVTKLKCYECFMHGKEACSFCHKKELTEESFSNYSAYMPIYSKSYNVYGKLIRWNGHNAQIRCVIDDFSNS